MKKFNEWQEEEKVALNESPEMLIEKIAELTHAMEMTLKTFTGERFEGFLSLVGTVNNLKRALVEVQTGTTSDKMTPTSESTSLKKKQVNVDYKADKSTGVRAMDSDLSKDYKKYAKKLGTVDPFKLVKKNGKNESNLGFSLLPQTVEVPRGSESHLILTKDDANKWSKLNKTFEAISSISNDGINRVNDKPIGDLTKNIRCRIMTRKDDEDIGFVSLPPDKYNFLSGWAAKKTGLSLNALKRHAMCHMTKFGLKDGEQIYFLPTNNIPE